MLSQISNCKVLASCDMYQNKTIMHIYGGIGI